MYAEERKNLIVSSLIDNEYCEKVYELLNKAISSAPKFFESYQTLAKLYYAKNQAKKAEKALSKALNLAKKQNVRQWQVNELLELKQVNGK